MTSEAGPDDVFKMVDFIEARANDRALSKDEINELYVLDGVAWASLAGALIANMRGVTETVNRTGKSASPQVIQNHAFAMLREFLDGTDPDSLQYMPPSLRDDAE